MSLLSRRRGESLTAAAQIITRDDLSGAPWNDGRMAQPWQQTAWMFYDTLAEIHYPTQFTANSIGRFQFRIGVVPHEDMTAPAVVDDLHKDAITSLAEDALADMDGPLGDIRALARRYAMNMMLTAEGYLIGTDQRGANSTDWEFLSVSEISTDGITGAMFRSYYGSPTQPATDEIKPAFIRRFWLSHPRFSYAPDSPMKALADDCERLRILNESMTARLLNRLSQAGILFVPNTLSIANDPGPPNGEGPIATDPFAMKLLNTFERQIMERKKGVIPIVIRGPDASGEKIKHITLDRVIDETEMKLRSELRSTIAIGLDLPPEIQSSLREASHWTSWSVMDSTVRSHLKPLADGFAEGLTRVYLWPYLRELGVDEGEIRRRVIVADSSDVMARPNEAEDGRALHDRLVISDSSLRSRSGAPDTDAPDDAEMVRQLGRKFGDPYLATFDLPIADEIDWSLVGAKQGGPGIGGTPPSEQPAGSRADVGGPGTGTAGDVPKQVHPPPISSARAGAPPPPTSTPSGD